MRLVQVAKLLGMTGQQLRHELSSVDFGVKPTDREIPDNLAQGIIRYVARKHNIAVDFDALGFDDGETEERDEQPSRTDNEEETVAATDAPPPDAGEDTQRTDALHVLRKLTLDDVPRDAIARQKKELTKEEKEEQQREARVQSRAAMQKNRPAATQQQQQIKRKEGTVMLPVQITVKEFAEKTGVQVPLVIQALMKNGILATVTQGIDFDTAAIIAADLGVQVEKEHETASVEQLLSRNLKDLLKDEPEHLEPRPPIVVVMGHVDHGKTSILDAIRKTDVVAGEAGGITQHIGAYQVRHDGTFITFLDTPGHEAFTAMRARGAQVTDIAILVVSAEEGVKDTTIEAINHAKDAGVPIIVAINKMDRPNADPERVKGELAAHGLQADDWGGQVPMIPCSAVTRQGIDDVLDHILLVAGVSDFKANYKRPAVATVIESHLDPSLGALATVIVNAGKLAVGSAFICGRTAGKIRSMTDAYGTRLQDMGPAGPVRISGFDSVPQVGDILQVMSSEKEARALLKALTEQADRQKKRTFSDLVSKLHEGKLQQLKMVLKADTQGSLEAIQAALAKKTTEDTQVKVIHAAIGAVSESDVMMAAASAALVVAFGTPVPPMVQRTADREGVRIREYTIIYQLLEDTEGLLEGLLEPEEQEVILGHVDVKGVFLRQKKEQIIGGRVTDGIVKRVQFRLMRSGMQVGTGRILSLRKVEKDIKEAKADTECGMRVESSLPVEEGDVLEVFNNEFRKKGQ